MKGFVRLAMASALATGVTSAALAQTPQDLVHAVAGRGIGDGRPATTATLDTPAGVAFAADGAVLIADMLHHRIRRVDPTSGVITTFMGTLEGTLGDGSPPDVVQIKSPVRVLVRKNGDVLVVERGGPEIRRVRKDTGLVDTVPIGTNIPGFTLNQPNDVAEDSAGNLYVADFFNHRILKVDALGNTTTFAGTGAPGFSGDGGPAASAALQYPACVEIGAGDVVYICDKGNHRIRRVQNGTIATIAGTGVGGFTGDGPATTVALNEPEDIVIVGGTLVIADQENNRIRQLDLASGQLTTLAGTGPASYAGDNAPAASSPIDSPVGLGLAPDGRILFSEQGANRVRALANGTLTTIAGDGVESFGGDGGAALDATFRTVEGVAQDAQGHLYVSDSGNNRIRKVDATTGTVTTLAGDGSTDFRVDGVPATVVGLDSPSDVVVDDAGNVVFSDTGHHRVRSVDPQGMIHTVMGTGVGGFAGDGGPAAAAQLASPTGLAFDAAGNLYVADFGNNRIRKIDKSGNVTTVVGDGNPTFNGDGQAALNTSLFNPTDVTFDSKGNMYVADMRNYRVRRVDATSGIVTTIAGTGDTFSSDDYLPAVTASLVLPTDVNVDAAGDVLIADSGSNRIRRVAPNGVIDTVAGARLPGDSGDEGPAIQARFLTPLRMFRAPNGRFLVVDRNNSRIRQIGEAAGGGGGGGGGGDPDCTKGTCSPGGGPKKTDCFLEFNTGLGSGQTITCKDGDPGCDHDQTPGQCTVRVQLCFGVLDPRLAGKCTPQPARSLQLVKPPASQGTAARALLDAFSSAGSVGGGSKPVITFTDALTGCRGDAQVVVPIKRKKGKLAIRTVTSIAGTGRAARDPDPLVIVCVH